MLANYRLVFTRDGVRFVILKIRQLSFTFIQAVSDYAYDSVAYLENGHCVLIVV